jgi:hypothetical protein
MKNETEDKNLEILIKDGWVKIDSNSDYNPSASGYSACSAVTSLLGKCKISCIIVYTASAKTINKFQIYVQKDDYEKASEVAKAAM